MSKQFWAALLAIMAILGAILVISNHSQNHSTSSSQGQATNHIEGTSPENVRLIEYGDYQCPVCGSFYSAVKQTTIKYTDKLVFQFRNLPLTSIHQNAFAGARAAEAAGLQNKYWEMHDMLYENQQAWTQSSNPQTSFDGYARSLGLNVTKFDTDYASDTVNNAITADENEFNKTGDDMATPTFYLDGKKLDNQKLVDSQGQPSLDAFSKVIDAELAKKAAAK